MSIVGKNISYEINGAKILEDIDFKLNQNEIVSILGPNGAGKSTLLGLLAGDILPTSGKVFYQGRELESISIQDRAFLRSVMSQSQQIIFDYSVKEIIEMGWIERGIAKYSGNFSEAVTNIADECDLKKLLHRKFNVLSGGEQRRVHYARTILQLWRHSNSNDERFMFLDEPTANLDLYYELKLMNSIKEKAKEGYGIGLIVHDLNLASIFSDKVLLLKNGECISYGEPSKVLTAKKLTEVYGIPMKVNDRTKRITYY